MLLIAKFSTVVAAIAAVAVATLYRRMKRNRHEIGDDIHAAMVVALSHDKPPPQPPQMRLVGQHTGDDTAAS